MNYTSWEDVGRVEFVLLNVFPLNMRYGGQLHITAFEAAGEDYTFAPTMTQAPSVSPSSLFKDKVAYVLRYAGEIRTVVYSPFQIENTGEILPMDGTVSYRLCMVDEVEGSKAEFQNRMNFLIDEQVSGQICPTRRYFNTKSNHHKQQCVSIRYGNPSVRLLLAMPMSPCQRDQEGFISSPFPTTGQSGPEICELG